MDNAIVTSQFFANIPLKALLFLTDGGISEWCYCIEKALKVWENTVLRDERSTWSK